MFRRRLRGESPDTDSRRITVRRMITYALPNLMFSVVSLPLALYIVPFYSSDLGLPLAGVGLAIAASRIFDVITDPLIGSLSDHTRSRWGRRKPWIFAGTPLLILSTWMLFVPGEQTSLVYLLTWTCVLFLGFTLVDLPYRSWGAELSTDYAERSRVTAWREGFGFFGQLLFVIVVLLVSHSASAATSNQLRIVATVVSVGAPILLAIALYSVPERSPDKLTGDPRLGWQGTLLIVRNPAFLRIVGAGLFFLSGLIVQATLHRIVLTHVILRPDLFYVMLLIENVVTICAIPLWVWISDRLGKHRALSFAALWVGAWCLTLPAFGPGDGWAVVAILVVRGMSFASILLLANSIAADVVDKDTVDSGRQRTGLYFAAWGMITKFAIGFGVLLATWIPSLLGFEPSDPVHSAAAKFGLMATYGWLPGILMTLGALFLWNFPITRERQRELRAQIAARRRP